MLQNYKYSWPVSIVETQMDKCEKGERDREREGNVFMFTMDGVKILR